VQASLFYAGETLNPGFKVSALLCKASVRRKHSLRPIRLKTAHRASSFLFVLKKALVVLWVCCTPLDILQSERTEKQQNQSKNINPNKDRNEKKD